MPRADSCDAPWAVELETPRDLIQHSPTFGAIEDEEEIKQVFLLHVSCFQRVSN